jgi:PAS domain S-box-containing protein
MSDAIIEKIPIAIYAIDGDRFIYVNSRFADMLGYTREEILAFGSVLDVIPDDKKSVVAELLRRRAGSLRDLHYITAARRRDGTVMEVEIRGSAAEIEENLLLIGAANDIRRYDEPSQRLSDRAHYFRGLLEGITDVIAILDPLGRITYVTPSVGQHLGGNWSDWLGRLMAITVHPKDRPRFSRLLEELLTNRSFGPEQFRLQHLDGSWREVEIAATNLLAHPHVQGFAFNLRDVTERNQAQENQRLATLGRVAAQVAHEFNNTLMGIDVNFRTLQRMLPDINGVNRAVRNLESSLARSKQLAADILELGRAPRVHLLPLKPDDVVQRIVEEVKLQIPESIKLEFERGDPPMIQADEQRIAQVLINLVLNARDAMSSSGGTLTIATSANNRGVHFKVTDTGEGIAPEHLESVFQPHFTTKEKGSGLGLSVVHQIITAHGGQISLDSQVGKGTTFDICIPMPAAA